MKKTFRYDEEGYAVCVIEYKHMQFCGDAVCHPDDEDFKSERVGSFIAEQRADLSMLRYKRDVELRPAIQTLEHLMDSFKRSSKHNKDSYESRMMRKELYRLKNELAAVTNTIANIKLELRAYIHSKEKFYQRIREARNKQS